MWKENAEEVEQSNHIRYGLGFNTLFPRIYKKTVDKWKNMR